MIFVGSARLISLNYLFYKTYPGKTNKLWDRKSIFEKNMSERFEFY